MDNLKNYNQFLNESEDPLTWATIGSFFKKLFNFGGSNDTEKQKEIGVNPTNLSGNDDYIFYMIHQQGLAGISGIIKSMLGTGELHPDTIKTKNGVKYANIVRNIPSDKPEAKKKIIELLDKKSYQKASALFLSVWKEKWNSLYKEAQSKINDPSNKKVKDAIDKSCKEFGIPKDFAYTVSYIESRFNPNAGNKTYKGLYSLRPDSTYNGVLKSELGNNWNNPYYNAKAGLKLMRSSIKSLKSSISKELSKFKMGGWINSIH